MIRFSGRGLLLDIEGTTSSVSYVYEVMFPFVRRHLDEFLEAHWGEAKVDEACRRIAADGRFDWKPARGPDAAAARRSIRDEVLRQMDADAKATGLKQLQGMIWKQGFQQGELKAHVYRDVPPALQRWHEAGRDVRIYSSGSVQAQKLFFAHTEYGDLLPWMSGHYDTLTGPKLAPESYLKIAADWGYPAGAILFLSDLPGELDAARQAGLCTALCRRPGNAPVPADHGHAELADFGQLEWNA